VFLTVLQDGVEVHEKRKVPSWERTKGLARGPVHAQTWTITALSEAPTL